MEKQDIDKLVKKVSLKDETFNDKDEVWKEIVSRVGARKRRVRIYWGVAASVAVAICIFTGLYSRVDVSSGDDKLKYPLPDGSLVELEDNSVITYNRLRWLFARRVVLEGNALFDVVKNNGTFSVVADKGTITVLGTRFSVLQQPDILYVGCNEGSVEVKTKTVMKVLHKGEQLDYDGIQMRITPILPDPPKDTSVSKSIVKDKSSKPVVKKKFAPEPDLKRDTIQRMHVVKMSIE